MSKKITIIDGNSLLFRAYFATAYPGVEIMRSQDGTPTNAIFAFSNMINKILNSIDKGDSLFVAFDAGKHNFRHEALETYKANRKPAPQELVTQFPIARDFLNALGIFQFEEEGFEGDDIAGTVAKLAEKNDYQVTLFTSDRDFLQLASDKITINIIRKGLSDVVPMNPSLIKETYGFEPLQIIDYKGLRGDSSDNLPGIPGVGDKTAVKLINEYGSFDNIIAHADEIKGKLGETIKENTEIGRISRDLAIIKTDVQLPFKLEDTIYHGYEFKIINEFCQKYGFKQFINKINLKWKKEGLNEENITYQEITSISGLMFDKTLGLALDFQDETDYQHSEIYSLALSNGTDNYLIHIEDVKKDQELLKLLKDKNVKKYCYDYKAIKVALHNEGIEIDGVSFDLLIASYLLDSSLKNNVDIVMNLFGVDLVRSDNELSLFNNENPLKTAQIANYSLKLCGKVKADLVRINALDLYESLELPLIDVLANIEIEGFPLDVKILDEYGLIFKAKLDALSNEIYELAGEKFNISSSKQLGDILYTKLGLPCNKKMSTAFENLKDLSDKHPIVKKIIEYRKYFKLVSTYIEGLKPHVNKDGKIHANFNQALTTTGRLSSSNPNLQNISVRDEESKEIRKAFHYIEKDYEILSLDYSQIELRILAHLSDSKGLKEILNANKDIHAETAKKIFHLENEPTTLQRRKAKTVNFGVVYGISDWGLADQLEIPVKEAKEIINSFYESFPEVASFFKKIVDEAEKQGYVSTMLGRRRYLREIHDSNYQVREFAKRAAMNAPIQGTAADLIKLAMIKVDKALKENKLETKMVLQIHDELIFKVPLKEKDKAIDIIKIEMQNAMSLSVPLLVDGGYGKDWYSAK